VEKPAPKPVEKPAPKPAAAPKAAQQTGGNPVLAPMPGTIVSVDVQPGQAVAKGDVLVILEAMKMENEIVADTAGTVVSIQVSKGSTVNSGDVLLSIA
jgi:biotin carboxyl carrier protein